MISSLEITGYKSIESINFQNINSVNIFMGPNNSGKSAILEALNQVNTHPSVIIKKPTFFMETEENINLKFSTGLYTDPNNIFHFMVSQGSNWGLKRGDIREIPNIYYVSADRGLWRRDFGITSPRPEYVGINGQNAPTFLFYLKENHEDRFQELRKFVEELGLEVKKISNYIPLHGRTAETVFLDPQTGLKTNMAAAGFGQNQLLPLIVQTFVAEDNAILLFEEPEISLHPGVQRVFIEKFTELIHKESKQAFLTSHSVYFLDTFRRWKKEDNDLLKKINLFAITRESGKTKQRLIDWNELIDDKGRNQIPPELRDFYSA